MSTQIVAFTQRMDFKTLLEIECKGLTGYAPVVKNTIEDFHSLVDLLVQIDILIIDEPPKSKDYTFLLEAISSKEEGVKNIILLSNGPSSFKNSTIFPLDKVESLIDHLKSLLANDTNKTAGYISVPSDSLIHFKILPFDLYIKVSEDKFVKRIPANEDIDEVTVASFKAKGILELHFERKYNRDFSLLLLNNMINKVERTYSNADEKNKAQNEVFLTTKELVQSVGLPPRVIQVCESVMESISDDVLKGKDKISSFLSKIKGQDNLRFQFSFIELTSFIATQIIDASDAADKAEQIKKVVFASFFCDISLTDPSHLDYRTEDSIKDLWPEDQKVIREHALKSSLLVENYKNAPQDAMIIIREHHGSTKGIGFAEMSPLTLPLSKILISAQELSYAILKNPKDPAKSVVNDVLKKFEGSPIHSYIALFEKTTPFND